MGEFKDKWVLGGCSGRMIKYQKEGGFVADVDTLSNAKLIVCAPEMLEALRELLPIAMEFINENHPTYKKVTELIKKATE